ncbi:YitT family protein [Neobacillus sp. DY30]|uniref:YitT family protein n=1 Tax=Neobacillus sp. DY30 TaxID=3047871 RepID=UPI0024BFAB58|nr:YitT family protein [Neobacillus sp. DY30]WHX98785.1 YitT family protein [Neobacillus sp. DY30]
MLKKLAVIGFGSTMIGIGLNGFILPFHLINGGMFGISIMFNYLWHFNIGITFVFLNIPVYLYAYKSDFNYFLYGLIGAFFSGFMIEFFVPLKDVFHLPIVSSVIIGGVVIGIGVGTMLRNHISPGGMDLLALLLAKRTKINVGIIAYAIDTMIIMMSLFILQEPRLLYSLLIVSIVGLLATVITSWNRYENN